MCYQVSEMAPPILLFLDPAWKRKRWNPNSSHQVGSVESSKNVLMGWSSKTSFHWNWGTSEKAALHHNTLCTKLYICEQTYTGLESSIGALYTPPHPTPCIFWWVPHEVCRSVADDSAESWWARRSVRLIIFDFTWPATSWLSFYCS